VQAGLDALTLSHESLTVEYSRKITAAILVISALLIAAIALYLNRISFGIGDDYSRLFQTESYRSAVYEREAPSRY
jgi:hypothetical protein